MASPASLTCRKCLTAPCTLGTRSQSSKVFKLRPTPLVRCSLNSKERTDARTKPLTGFLKRRRRYSSPCQSFSRDLSSSATSCPASTANLPLHGVKVLDLSRVLAGPFCTQILADYGADVIKIEQPGTGDETRQWRTSGESAKWKPEHRLMSLYFAAVNRNKKSVTVNLKSPQGVDIIKKLARESDVMVNNFLPGKMEEMGLGWEDLRKENPALIYASVSGYGASGPSMSRAGYDAIALAEAGLLHITGESGGPPTKPGVAIADLCTGLYTHGAILAALHARQQTGTGTKIDGSLFESSLSLLINVGLASLNLGLDKGPSGRRRGKRLGLAHPNLVPYGGFQTKDDRYVFVAANNNRQWHGFCRRMEIDGLADDKRFHSNDGRVEHRAEIVQTLERKFREQTLQQWLDVFEGSGLPYGAINDVVEALENPQAHARKMVADVEDIEAARDGMIRMIGPPMKFGGVDMNVRIKPPLLGEHTEGVLMNLGYNTDTIDRFRKEGIV